MVFSDFMRGCDEKPNEFLLASVMCACAQIGMLELGTQVHDFVVKSGFIYNVYVGTAMINFYAELGKMDDARMVFDELKEKSLVTWTTIITGYCSRGQSDVSLELFHELMGYANVVPDKYIISSVLSACSRLHYLEGGMQMHAYVLRRGSFMDVSVMNVLIDFYLKCGRVRHGRRLFDQFAVKDAISWTIMIAGYMQNSFDTDAVQLFSELHKLGWTPDDFVCSSILTACGSLEALVLGVQVHGYAIKVNLEPDEFVKSSLIDMYSKCNSLTDARRAFDSVVHNNVVSYNAMIEGYSRQDKVEEALNLFHGMRHEMLQPSVLTFVSLLAASASLSALDLSKQIHGLVFKMGMRRNMFIISALIDVYCTCNFLQDARLVFEEINEKDVVVWNAMLFGYTRKLESEEALKLYNQLQEVGEKANEFTFVVMINAASSLASCHGQQFHSQLLKTGFDLDSIVRNALLDMYAKCGCLQDAHKLFNTTKKKDVACWNSMISTCANHGQAEQALSLYRQMLKEGVQPNYVTFVGLLSACSHAGLVEVGLEHFNTMLSCGIEPGTEHYACIVSLYGRAGKPTDAKEFIEKMPVKPAAIVWKSLLSSCQATGDFELGTYAAEKAISSDPADSGSYILLSNIYASKGMWAQVKKIRERMERNLVVKEPGCSWIELNDGAHVFVAKDKSHRKADLIFSVLDKLIQGMKAIGSVPDNDAILASWALGEKAFGAFCQDLLGSS
ncbi:hypothetical protein Cgig2_026021 [Carnegiea gigantea]|uniref:Pentatricopeptide repeat-containing protein n=1 Tax=Carnegiea gigantea TaxID=171969 RepID=A0A9Q1QL22_9CARY|nr:hypothetical protein Cgig2_026021 [Carnegiea gigantea]